ncbi:DUF4230 domain-containing protein [Nocardioides zeicaulis]|uniref:DUF4230 domain-containing protein n=1 Tax=Nocardioides zeicaulis TaxID=1776857 RepID=A0ABV6E1A0_9ACTN
MATKEHGKLKVDMSAAGPRVGGEFTFGQLVKLVVALIAAAAIGIAAFVGLGVFGLFSIPNIFKTERIDRSAPPVLKSIEDLAEFRAAVGNFEVVLDIEDDVNNLPDFLAGERNLYVVTGTVDAYVDFSGLAKGDITLSEDGTKATIRLPEVELGEPNLDHENTYRYENDRGLLTRVGDAFSAEDDSTLFVEAEDKLATAAEASELKEQALSNTKDTLGSICKALGVEATFVD